MSTIDESHLSNKDLAPTGAERRTWGTYHLAALWGGLSIVITTYTLASGVIAGGRARWEGARVRVGAACRGLRRVRDPDVGRRPRPRHADDAAGGGLGRRERSQGDRVRRV